MYKLTPLLLLGSSLLIGCTDIQQARLNHDYRTGCMATYTVRCTDVNIKLMILHTRAQKEELLAHEAVAVQDIGHDNYQKILDLLDQKIKHLKSERPNILLRWFRGEDEYQVEVDDGWRIDAQIQALGNKALRQQAQKASIQPRADEVQDVTSTGNELSMEDQLKAAITAPVQTADEANRSIDDDAAAQRDAELAMQDALASTQASSGDDN